MLSFGKLLYGMVFKSLIGKIMAISVLSLISWNWLKHEISYKERMQWHSSVSDKQLSIDTNAYKVYIDTGISEKEAVRIITRSDAILESVIALLNSSKENEFIIGEKTISLLNKTKGATE